MIRSRWAAHTARCRHTAALATAASHAAQMQRVAAVLAFLYGGERIRPRPSQLLRFGDGGAGAFGGGWRSDSDDRSGRAHTLHDVAGNVTTRTYMIPADAPATTGSPGDVPGRLEGGVARPAVGDPRGICALTVRAALTGAKHNASSRLRVRSGHRIRVEGTLSCPSPGSQTITVSLVNASHLRSSHTWRIATRSDGAYTVLLRPRVSGRIIAAFSGSTNFRSTRAGARELIRVVPIIQALSTHTGRQAALVNPTVHGRVLPNPEAGITLLGKRASREGAGSRSGLWQPPSGPNPTEHSSVSCTWSARFPMSNSGSSTSGLRVGRTRPRRASPSSFAGLIPSKTWQQVLTAFLARAE